jgi:hypothetical protein
MASLIFILQQPGAFTMPIDPHILRLSRAKLLENNKAASECHGNFVLTEPTDPDIFATP